MSQPLLVSLNKRATDPVDAVLNAAADRSATMGIGEIVAVRDSVYLDNLEEREALEVPRLALMAANDAFPLGIVTGYTVCPVLVVPAKKDFAWFPSCPVPAPSSGLFFFDRLAEHREGFVSDIQIILISAVL